MTQSTIESKNKQEVNKGKVPAKETILSPRFYTTDFEAMENMDLSINEEIENQLVENKQNNCYQYMEKQIKESAKKIFYEQIDEDIELTTLFDNTYGGYLSLWNDFPIDAIKDYPEFQLKCKNFKAVSIAATLEKEAAEAPAAEAPVEAAAEPPAEPSSEAAGGKRRTRKAKKSKKQRKTKGGKKTAKKGKKSHKKKSTRRRRH